MSISASIPSASIALVITSLVGCSGGGCELAGTVTVDGVAVKEGRIALRPTEKSPDSRTVQAVITDGAFVFVPAQGVVPAKYDVVITARRKTGRTLPAEEGTNDDVARYEQYLPAKYNTATELSIAVEGDAEQIAFELELPKNRRASRR